MWRGVRAFLVFGRKIKLLTFGSGGFAEYQIRDTIHWIVLNLLTTCENWWFFIWGNLEDIEYEREIFIGRIDIGMQCYSCICRTILSRGQRMQ